jgi:hypothetical protein
MFLYQQIARAMELVSAEQYSAELGYLYRTTVERKFVLIDETTECAGVIKGDSTSE